MNTITNSSGDVDNLAEFLQDKYDISPSWGCLPASAPLSTLRYAQWYARDFKAIEEIGNSLPDILRNGTLEQEIKRIPLLRQDDIDSFQDDVARLLMVRLAFIAHAYVWEYWRKKDAREIRKILPANLAVPLLILGKRFGCAPLLNYWNYALWNWMLKTIGGPIVPENIKLIQNFLGGESEEWFVVLHVVIEKIAAPMFTAAWELSEAVKVKNQTAVSGYLHLIASTLEQINGLFRRMPEHCDTEEYFTNVRPYLYGWKDKNIFPDGLFYTGQKLGEGRHLRFPGETGAQSFIAPCLDRLLDIIHEPSPLSEHLHDMLHVCAVEKQRNFVLAVENRPRLSAEVAASFGKEVEGAYWKTRKLLAEFRAIHFYYALEYIQKQAAKVPHPFGDKASGGSPYVASLWKHFSETLGGHLLEDMGGEKEAFTSLIWPFSLKL